MRRTSSYRHLSTRALLAARECVAWDRADLASDPAGWDFPEETATYLAEVVAPAITAELTRRERLRRHPLAPAWPDGRAELDEIKRRLDLVTYIERMTATEFHPVGRQLRAYCPFPDHPAHSWSFVVNQEKQVWHCFGCLRGGDLFDFAGELLGLDFPAVVKLLAQEAGIRRAPRSIHGDRAGRSRVRTGSVRVA